MKEISTNANFDTGTNLEQEFLKLRIAFLAVFSIIALISLGAYDFYTRGEAREALVVQRILNTGEWLVTRGYGDTVASKPPLFHWLAACCSALLGGPTEFSIRLPSLLSSLAAALFFLAMTGKYLSSRGRTFFILAILFSFEWLRASLSSRVDMVHSAAMSCAILAMYQALEFNRRHWILFSGLLLGLSILSKGPVGIALPMLIAGIWMTLEKRINTSSLITLGIIGALGTFIGACWYVPALMNGFGELWSKIWYENVSRFTSSMEDAPHRHSSLYLFGMLIVGTLPWPGIAVWKIYPHLRSFRRIRLPSFWRSMSPFEHLCLITVAVTFLFFCIPSGKRSVYLLSMYPFLVFLLASKVAQFFSNQSMQRLFTACILIVSLVQFIAIPFFMAPQSSERQLAREIQALIPENAHIYSFGFEFYGASFYADRTIYRLEDAIDMTSERHQAPEPVANDVVIVFDHDIEELKSKALENSITLTPEKTIRIGSQEVFVVGIS